MEFKGYKIEKSLRVWDMLPTRKGSFVNKFLGLMQRLVQKHNVSGSCSRKKNKGQRRKIDLKDEKKTHK